MIRFVMVLSRRFGEPRGDMPHAVLRTAGKRTQPTETCIRFPDTFGFVVLRRAGSSGFRQDEAHNPFGGGGGSRVPLGQGTELAHNHRADRPQLFLSTPSSQLLGQTMPLVSDEIIRGIE